MINTPFHIGPVKIRNRVVLAPMSGISDLPFRRLAWRFGAGLVVTEMIASRELVCKSRESQVRLKGDGLSPHMVQLAGREEKWMREGAIVAEANGADVIDINMGCPAKKVTGGYSGSALMRDLDHALRLIEATVEAVKVPVTLKMRLGWDENSINAPELAFRAQEAGVQLITVHGRTRCQFYKGSANWRAIKAVRDALSVPLIANGDVETSADVSAIRSASGADAVMIGRAAQGQPWLVGALAGQPGAPETIDGIAELAMEHYDATLVHYGVPVGMRHFRKHLGWYIGRFAPDCPPDVKARIMTGLVPDQVSREFRSALRVFGTIGALPKAAA